MDPMYDAALVCRNGHMINDRSTTDSVHNKRHCPKCGEPTIAECPNCGRPILGAFREPGSWREQWRVCYDAPAHCHECGGAYPWTQRRKEALLQAIELGKGLTEEDRQTLRESIPDILTETPKTRLAVEAFKRLAKKASEGSGKAIFDMAVQVAAAVIAKQLTG